MHTVIWMTGALISFSLMAICARELSGEIAIHQTLFFRSAIGLVVIFLIFRASSERIKLSTNRLGLHTIRNVFHFVGQYGWFVGIGLLPLAEVFALEFTVPIWTLIVASLVLGETVTARKVIAIILGSVGVGFILQPGIEIIDKASLIVLAAAICFAVSHVATKSLSTSDSATSILLYMCLVQLPIGFFLSLSNWVWPVGLQWLWLLVIGLTALSAHYCMVRAMQYAEVTTVVTLDFLRLPLIALVGVVLYLEKFELSLIIGGFFMLIGNIVSLKNSSSNKSNNVAPSVCEPSQEKVGS